MFLLPSGLWRGGTVCYVGSVFGVAVHFYRQIICIERGGTICLPCDSQRDRSGGRGHIMVECRERLLLHRKVETSNSFGWKLVLLIFVGRDRRRN